MYDIKIEEYHHDHRGPRIAAVVIGAVLVGLLGWFLLRPALSDDDSSDAAAVSEADAVESSAHDDPAGTARAVDDADEADEADVGAMASESDAPPATDGTDTEGAEPDEPANDADASSDADDRSTDDASTDDASTDEGSTDAGATDPSSRANAAPLDSAPPTDTDSTGSGPSPSAPPASAVTSAASQPSGEPASYPTLPDGSPAPVVAVFGEDRITLTGSVPTGAAKDRLQALSVANAKPGQASTIADFVTINPDVPAGVGVRVVELTSARFPDGSSEVLPDHAAELDRAAGILDALPNVTALVIGHADQRGDADTNFDLSADRAEAVVDYLAFKGISPDRLSSRAVGENDLLTLNDDDVAFALNRRTEFVFYGLLLE